MHPRPPLPTAPDRVRDTTRAEAAVAALAREIDAQGFRAHGLHVLIGDGTAARRWTPDVREEIHSVAKGVSVLAAAIASDEGLFDIDAPVATSLPDLALGEGVAAVTVRHLLTMSSGIDLPWSETMFDDWPDLAREFLSRPSRGRVFQYANASTYTAMRALAAVVGDVEAWATSRIFEPLGIEGVTWRRCPAGWVLGGEGIALRTEELARLGRLIRDRGVWQGRRVVAPEWIDAMHTDWVKAGANPGYDRYALAGWGGPGEAWRLHGAHGQLLIFTGDAVVTLTADDHFGADRIAQVAVDVLARV